MVKISFSQEEVEELKKLNIEIKDKYTLEEVEDILDEVGDEVGLHFNKYGEPDDRACIVLENIIDKLTSVEGYN